MNQIAELYLPSQIIRKLRNCRSLDDLIEKIDEIYPDNFFHSVVVLDQINFVTKEYRDLNSRINLKKTEDKLGR